ncbi:MAG: sulfite dehydrogenase [Pseudomonadota bacterium]
MHERRRMNRRRWLRGHALVGLASVAPAARAKDSPPAAASAADAVPALPVGALPGEIGERALEIALTRRVGARALSGWSQTPLESLTGLLTPSDLHFERHHGGIPALSATDHELLVHGLVRQPKRFDLAALKRFPAVTRVYFIECSGNGYASTLPVEEIPAGLRPSDVDGLFSVSEWTGLSVRDLLEAVGLARKARWALAEGADSAAMTRSIPVAKLLDDALLVYGQNGEPLRPAQGYPLRLLLPGYEGNMSIKWLKRLEFSDAPFMTREETARYSDPRADGRVELFSFSMGPKSLITEPAGPGAIGAPGYREIRGLAWSGRGSVRKVEVSVDGGRRWRDARLDGPASPQGARRFALGWSWDGAPALLMSRATDSSGASQPGYSEARQGRGQDATYHNNAVRGWRLDRDGGLQFAMADPIR